MIDELSYAEGMMKLGGYTLVLCRGGNVFFSEERGIKPLFYLADTDEWADAYAADKIVGKAAALLYAKLGVRAVFAEVMSKTAVKIFEEAKISFKYDVLTDGIINRKGTDLCPVELAVKDIKSPDEAFEAVKQALEHLS